MPAMARARTAPDRTERSDRALLPGAGDRALHHVLDDREGEDGRGRAHEPAGPRRVVLRAERLAERVGGGEAGDEQEGAAEHLVVTREAGDDAGEHARGERESKSLCARFEEVHAGGG